MIAEFKKGGRKVLRTRPIRHQGNIYISPFPNPVHIFLSSAIDQFSLSENIKDENFPKCGKPLEDNLYILDIEENGTHECYNQYIKARTSCIVMLVSAVEAFLNQIIPNHFVYRTEKKGKQVKFDKKAIESSQVPFKVKLVDVIKQVLNQQGKTQDLTIEQETIEELYQYRKDIVHLKTHAQTDFSAYFDSIDKMLEFDLGNSIEMTINYMNKIQEGYISFE
ncbi:hypothetical protein [Robiginitalea biformata]|uniref:hypothetical protein n=1 Tax=Robiginitalea biformata TaxID=252307 RepID=UPI003B5A4BCD